MPPKRSPSGRRRATPTRPSAMRPVSEEGELVQQQQEDGPSQRPGTSQAPAAHVEETDPPVVDVEEPTSDVPVERERWGDVETRQP